MFWGEMVINFKFFIFGKLIIIMFIDVVFVIIFSYFF